jgi:hypothetical protein
MKAVFALIREVRHVFAATPCFLPFANSSRNCCRCLDR